ncbi:unnamed protein product, partial [Discosporangium mesarthrocarpum]
ALAECGISYEGRASPTLVSQDPEAAALAEEREGQNQWQSSEDEMNRSVGEVALRILLLQAQEHTTDCLRAGYLAPGRSGVTDLGPQPAPDPPLASASWGDARVRALDTLLLHLARQELSTFEGRQPEVTEPPGALRWKKRWQRSKEWELVEAKREDDKGYGDDEEDLEGIADRVRHQG